MTTVYYSFRTMSEYLYDLFKRDGEWVQPSYWQGKDVGRKPEARMRELLNVSLEYRMGNRDLEFFRGDIQPFLPWADDHFAERVCGWPLNPGSTWDKWRHGESAARWLNADGQFNHSYMERLWPRYAGHLGKLKTVDQAQEAFDQREYSIVNAGIRHSYGDLQGIVSLLARDPLTRQAYIPLFFPEDTGIGDGDRKPCTLGYQFIRRGKHLHCFYPMRSCDFANHFADDVYLAVRLTMWVLEELRKQAPDDWRHVYPGAISMHITSLHMFVNDYNKGLR